MYTSCGILCHVLNVDRPPRTTSLHKPLLFGCLIHVHYSDCIQHAPGPWFNIKMLSYQYRRSHCGDKTVGRSSYLHNGISYTGRCHLYIESGPWSLFITVGLRQLLHFLSGFKFRAIIWLYCRPLHTIMSRILIYGTVINPIVWLERYCLGFSCEKSCTLWFLIVPLILIVCRSIVYTVLKIRF